MKPSIALPNGIWCHADGDEQDKYEVLFVANLGADSPVCQREVVYQGLRNGARWTMPLSMWHEQMTVVPVSPMDNGAVILGVLEEMRDRRVNNGKHGSATLVAWADRLERAFGRIVPLENGAGVSDAAGTARCVQRRL